MASALVPIILSSCSPGLYQGQFTKTRMQNKNPKVDSPLTWSGLVCYQKEFDNCFGANCPNRLRHNETILTLVLITDKDRPAIGHIYRILKSIFSVIVTVIWKFALQR